MSKYAKKRGAHEVKKNKAAQQLGRLGGAKKSAAKTASSAANGALGGRPCADITVEATGKWKKYWTGPLPVGATACGTVTRNRSRETGALLLTAAGIYAQGNAGALRSLDQAAVIKQLK